MADSGIKQGMTGTAKAVVSQADLASSYGNPGVDVLSSMTLMTLLEQACLDCIQQGLKTDEMCVGARMEMDHLAPTPLGFTVIASARLQEVKGAKLVFSVEAHDGKDRIAKAVHIRFIVSRQGFMKQVAEKAAQGDL